MTNRIAYIDALRGFVMILVVLGHVPIYSYHTTSIFSFSLIPSTFHLALFFFISGWFVKRDGKSLWKVIKEKFVQLVISTTIFYLLYCWLNHIDIVDNLWHDKYKAGYWFCIVLFCFFVITKLLHLITARWKHSVGGVILALAFGGIAIMFNTNAMTRLLSAWDIPNILCLQQWQYFIFFYLGHLAHEKQEKFFSLLDNGIFMGISIAVFFTSFFLLYQQPVGIVCIITKFLLWGGIGSMLSFAFFRNYEEAFQQNTRIGKSLQYIGRRTLDVYLLHFFFLPGNLQVVGAFFKDNSNPTVELFTSLAISLMTVALCLLTSNIIRLSPNLAHWMLGVKKQ